MASKPLEEFELQECAAWLQAEHRQQLHQDVAEPRGRLRNRAYREPIEARLALHGRIADQLLAGIASRATPKIQAELLELAEWLVQDRRRIIADVFSRPSYDPGQGTVRPPDPVATPRT